jgi:hypothetical protein
MALEAAAGVIIYRIIPTAVACLASTWRWTTVQRNHVTTSTDISRDGEMIETTMAVATTRMVATIRIVAITRAARL